MIVVKCKYGSEKGICKANGYPCDHAKEHNIIDNCTKENNCSPDLFGTLNCSCKEVITLDKHENLKEHT